MAKLDIPDNLWTKCSKCNAAIFNKDLEANLKVCPKCNYHFKLSAAERIAYTVDEGTFEEFDPALEPKDFLGFVDTEPYSKRINSAKLKAGTKEAIITGKGTIGTLPAAMGIMDFSYMGGSMGSVVGEKVTRIIEYAIDHKLPVIIVSSSGGARMQEGIMSLMQMAKTSAALGRLREYHLPYISIMTDPTTGGTSASYAMLGDINLAEPGALICFAGPRVIEQTIRQKLPPGFQRAEYLQQHGMVDKVVHRKDMRDILIKTLEFFKG
ncbi:MAG: acetyl-CoA carboxylase, carboxyltransferase subunit beta [Candidatus Saganbacteria bacterium]|nr:acetyl-CoA carboxylase, carboxyltransferase subunit beta [Candidatus Saganbacteria bacterium]